MRSTFSVYVSGACSTFLWLMLAYALLLVIYMCGPILKWNPSSDPDNIIPLLRFLMSVPTAMVMILMVLPLVVLGRHLRARFTVPRYVPMLAIFPMSFAMHLIIALAVPLLLVPIFVVAIFIFPSGSISGDWRITEVAISSAHFSFVFTLLWIRLERLFDSRKSRS